jgi:type IX secretion system PorP/SprF family membrane protein
MKRIVLLMGLLLITCLAHAQKYYITNQYVYDLYLMNPAAASFYKGCITVNGYYQKQWFGMDQAPTTQIMSYQGPATEQLGMGLYVYNDRNGFFSEMGFQGSLSYEVVLLKKRRRRSTLSFGMSVIGEQSAINETGLSDGALLDPAISGGIENGWGFNANAGVLLKYNEYHAGIAVSNLLPQNNSMYHSVHEPPLTMDVHLHLGTTYKIADRDIFLEPLLMYRRNMLVDSRMDLNVKGYFPTNDPDFSMWGLLGYRHTMDHQFGKSLGMATTVGVQYSNFSVGLEYQLGLTKAQHDYGSAYQLVVGYRYCKDRSKASIPCSEKSRKQRKKAARRAKK